MVEEGEKMGGERRGRGSEGGVEFGADLGGGEVRSQI
jgi:hypothetical protein